MRLRSSAERPLINRAVALFAGTVVLALLLSTISTVMMVRFAKTNRTANLVNCRLLTNAIVESGAGGVSTKPTLPQLKLNALYISVINRSMTAQEKKQQAILLEEIKRKGGIVTIPNCKDVVDHPNSVKDVVPIPSKEKQ